MMMTSAREPPRPSRASVPMIRKTLNASSGTTGLVANAGSYGSCSPTISGGCVVAVGGALTPGTVVATGSGCRRNGVNTRDDLHRRWWGPLGLGEGRYRRPSLVDVELGRRDGAEREPHAYGVPPAATIAAADKAMAVRTTYLTMRPRVHADPSASGSTAAGSESGGFGGVGMRRGYRHPGSMSRAALGQVSRPGVPTARCGDLLTCGECRRSATPRYSRRRLCCLSS